MSDLDQVRSEQRGIARSVLTNRIGFELNFEVFQFILLNNELLDKGFVITKDNREEKYLEIINTNDQGNIDLLTRYLESLDSLSPHMFYYEHYKKLSKAIDEATDEATIKNLVADYMKIYG